MSMANEGADAVPNERDDVSRVGAEGVRELGSREKEDEVCRRVEEGEVLRAGGHLRASVLRKSWDGKGERFSFTCLQYGPAIVRHGQMRVSREHHVQRKEGETHRLRGWSGGSRGSRELEVS